MAKLIPSGTSANRPKASAGQMRFNTDTHTMEIHDGTGWIVVGEGTPVITAQWIEWFAWKPVRVKGRWKWLRKVFRRKIPQTYVDQDDWQKYEYGTVFDAIRDNK